MAWRLVQKGTLLHALALLGGPLSCTCFDIGRDSLDDSDTPICLLVWASRNLRWRQYRLTPWWVALAQQPQRLTCSTNRPVRPGCIEKK